MSNPNNDIAKDLDDWELYCFGRTQNRENLLRELHTEATAIEAEKKRLLRQQIDIAIRQLQAVDVNNTRKSFRRIITDSLRVVYNETMVEKENLKDREMAHSIYKHLICNVGYVMTLLFLFCRFK